MHTPNQNCTPLCTPKSDLYPLPVPPTKKFYPNKLHLRGFFNFAYPCGLLMYPLWPLHIPLGVCVLQVENRCSNLPNKYQYLYVVFSLILLLWYEEWVWDWHEKKSTYLTPMLTYNCYFVYLSDDFSFGFDAN